MFEDYKLVYALCLKSVLVNIPITRTIQVLKMTESDA